jgi:hypothetical protein
MPKVEGVGKRTGRDEAVPEIQYDEIAGIDPQGGRLVAMLIEVTVTSGPAGLNEITNRQIHLKHTVVAV